MLNLNNVNIIVVQEDETFPLFVVTNKDIKVERLLLTINGVKTDNKFLKQNNKLYKTFLNLKNGEYSIEIYYENELIAKSIIKAENTIKKLIDIETGNWEIKDYQLIIKDKDNNEIIKFNLYDKYGQPTNLSVFKKERVN